MSATVVVRAYRFALDPTPSQTRGLERHAGAARFAFNWALATVKANIGQRNAPALGWAWNRAKGEVAPWWVSVRRRRSTPGWTGWPAG